MQRAYVIEAARSAWSRSMSRAMQVMKDPPAYVAPGASLIKLKPKGGINNNFGCSANGEISQPISVTWTTCIGSILKTAP
eukprot:1894218-Pleurochrysis_carterae.AAC.3